MTLTLTEFLLARIAEDEERARRVGTVDHPLSQDDYFRVLAECDAKRRIVAECETLEDQMLDGGWYITAQDRILSALALPYADHPDYREEWRP